MHFTTEYTQHLELTFRRNWTVLATYVCVKESVYMSLLSDKFEPADEPPASENVTAYDRQHLAIYLSILYAAGEGHSVEMMARDILGLDPVAEPDRAQRVTGSHLRRARWLAESGHQALLQI